MNIKRIGLVGGGFTGNNGNLGSNIHIGTGDPNLDVSDGSIFIGTNVYIEHGFDTRNISNGEGLWKLDNELLISSSDTRSIRLGTDVVIGTNAIVVIDGNTGIKVKGQQTQLSIGAYTEIGGATSWVTINNSGISIIDSSYNLHLHIGENFNTDDYFNIQAKQILPDAIPFESLSNGNIKIGETLFMPATPSGDPMHYAYETAGAEYNATADFIVKDAPWKDMVDTIEDKAKWGFDVVDASQVKQMTIGGTTYNYVQTTRTSPEGTTEPRYFIVGQASDGSWVEDETKVLHLPGHWYLNGLGDITNAEMRRIQDINTAFVTISRGLQDTTARTIIFNQIRGEICLNTNSMYSKALMSIIGPKQGIIETPDYFDTFLHYLTRYCYTLRWRTNTGNNYNPLSNSSQARVFYIKAIGKSLRVLSKYLSKSSIVYMIENASPTIPMIITLHADRYAQLAEDTDIITALETKNAALEGTNASISLVSA